ncbi:MAG: leucine-rich repeat domain-containing protein, partial [Clostridia bacterium]|nr:leucine-rich repeat domain-containing protein [Clostridia bacterium]
MASSSKCIRTLSLFLAAIMILSFSFAASAFKIGAVTVSHGTCGENVTYTFYEEEHRLIISGSGQMKSFHPESLGTVRTIIIEEGVTSICPGFCRSVHLTELSVPDSIEVIGDYAFYGSGLTEFDFPANLKKIGNYAFAGNWLKKAVVPYGTEYIGSFAFMNCNDVDLSLPDTVTHIGESILYGTRKYNIFCGSDEDVLYASNHIVDARKINNKDKHVSGHFIVKPTVVSIADRAFMDIDTLTGITLPSTLEYIGDYAFWRCSSLEEIVIPDSVTYLGINAFERCSSIKKAVIGKGLEAIENDAFANCSSMKTLSLPERLKSIGERAFSECSALESVTIPRPVKTLSGSAFSGCKTLQTVSIPSGILEIGYQAFSQCSGLKTLNIENGVKYIEGSAFARCENLSDVTLPDSIKSIGGGAFNGCKALYEISLPDRIIGIGGDVFYGTGIYKNSKYRESGTNAIYIGNHLISARYVKGDEYTVKNGTITVAGGAFNETEVKKIHFPDSVKYIDNYVFDTKKLDSSITKTRYNITYIENYLISARDTAGKILDGTVLIAG